MLEGKILITGASGLLGRALLKQCWDEGRDVVGQGLNRLVYRGVRLDLKDLLYSDVILKMLELGAIVHCAAERRPDVCEKNPREAKKLNVDVSRVLSEFCALEKIPFIFISTDYVFDGIQAPYRPLDRPNPLNSYGKMKEEAEREVLSVNPDAIVLRVPVLYGEIEYLEESALTVIAKNMLEQKISVHDSEAVRFPTHVAQVAKVIVQMLDQFSKLQQSIYHWSGNEAWTKFEIAQLLQREMTVFRECQVEPEYEKPSKVQRPMNCQLYCGDLEKMQIGAQIDFQKAFKEILENFFKKKRDSLL